MQISEFTVWLRSRTNKHHRPFQADTIAAYADAARALSEWMSGQETDGDFTACDAAVLNRFFAGYLASHGQGGTNTRQRNLRHLFTWLEETCGHPHPWTPELQRYAPAKKRPSTLAQEFIADLLDITGGGKARHFEDARDHAMIRALTKGVRRTELIQLQTTDLSTDLIARPFVRDVPLKGGREYSDGPIVPLAAVVGLPDADLGEVVGAAVALTTPASEAELTAYGAQKLSSFAVPAQWWLRSEQLPTNDAGKVLKHVIVDEWLHSAKKSADKDGNGNS